jgi:serine/threonine-protein kinase HipA
MVGRLSGKRALDVCMNGELVGRWSYSPRGENSFSYDASWIASPNRRPLSLSMPLSMATAPFSGAIVVNYFDNLLPDSMEIRQRAARKFGAASIGAFDILERIGRDCIGAVMLLPAGAQPPDVKRIDAEALSDAQIENLLDAAISPEASSDPNEEELRISLAGAQEKTALVWHDGRWCKPHGATPTTHILKLPIGPVGMAQKDFSTSVENEWLCGRIAQAFGLPAAESGIWTFGRHRVLAVERFDRIARPNWILRLPQEDFCQVVGHPAGGKYESHGGPGMADILDCLRGSISPAEDRHNFLAAQLLFWMLAAPDGHAKNFSIFLERAGAYRLTPLYDILSAWPVIGTGPRKLQWQKLKLAMAVRAGNAHYKMAEIRRRHWSVMAKANLVGGDFDATIRHFIDRTPAVIDHVAAQLPADFPMDVAGPIFDGLRAQAKALAAQEPGFLGGSA